MNKHDAILATHKNVVIIHGDDAYDANGNVVIYNANTIQSYIDSKSYIEKRQAEYPPITDYLDGIVKGDQEQIDKYIADCQAVKTKYPKS